MNQQANGAQGSAGERAYQREVDLFPYYPNGARRPSWAQLSQIARWSWERNPTDRYGAWINGDSPSSEGRSNG